jgi:hypothetical protein
MTPYLPHLKQLQEVSLFYFIYVYEANQLHLHSPSHEYPPTHTHTLYLFYRPVFIVNSKVNVERDFLLYPHYGYTSLWSVQPLTLFSPYSFPVTSHYSTAFQYMTLHPLPAQVQHVLILTFIIFCSFPSFPEFHRIVSLF